MNFNGSNQTVSLFQPIHSDVIREIEKDQLCLHSTFWVNNNRNKQVHVVMSSNYITLAEKNSYNYNYLFYVQTNFDLKFEVIYTGDNKNPQKNQPSKTSRPIGFRLLKENAMNMEFIIVAEHLLPVWIKYLSKNINQLGFHNTFKPLRKLGKGGFATVYEVERVTDGKLFAVKAFAKQNTLLSQNKAHRENLLNQIAMMRQIDHPNLIKLEGVFQSQNSLYVVLQLYNEGHLHSKINKRHGKFSLSQIKRVVGGLLKGLSHLQQKNIMHRDIKPQNIMLRNELDPVLVDFGLAANIHASDYIFYRCGTPGYVSPEVTKLQKGEKISTVCDVFSVGVIFHIMLVARPLFSGSKFEEVYDNNKHMRFNLRKPEYNTVDPSAMDLLQKMLLVNPKDRVSAGQALRHPFLSGQGMQVQKQTSGTTITLLGRNNEKIF